MKDRERKDIRQESVQSRTQLYKPDMDMKTAAFTDFRDNSASYFNKVEQGGIVRIVNRRLLSACWQCLVDSRL